VYRLANGLRDIAYQNQRGTYDLLMKAAAAVGRSRVSFAGDREFNLELSRSCGTYSAC
jgi:hypothetical protein